MAVIGVTASPRGHVRKYLQAIEKPGAQSCLLTPSGPSRDIRPLLDTVDGLLLPGGTDIDPALYGQERLPTTGPLHPAFDGFELALVGEALSRDMPVLAICRGMQLLNIAFGGKLLQHVPGHDVKAGNRSIFHEVFISPGSRLATVVGQGHGGFPWVNSRHHQGIDQARLGEGLLATCYSPSDGLIEAVESHAHRFVLGVQWHPERLEDYQPGGVMHRKFLKLFDALAGYAVEYAERKVNLS
ncbi:MAG: gamma-glutamyl-gamma-aminobutyrate hydrolase family protein [Chloroflexi bacterium]|nr:gamma-glutamyl-gamma-aminobutyrate hydrolase family protein [Chloroflexota bacterium]